MTPVRTEAPSIRVVWPTRTPGTSVIAFASPGGERADADPELSGARPRHGAQPRLRGMEVLRLPDSVSIVAVDGGLLVVVRQTRAGAGGRTLELPAGSIEDGETPEECAARELVEECGLTAGFVAEAR